MQFRSHLVSWLAVCAGCASPQSSSAATTHVEAQAPAPSPSPSVHVGMQFFIVEAGTGEIAVPKALHGATPCEAGECRLVAAPALFADVGSKATLQAGASGTPGMLFIDASAQPSGDRIASTVQVRRQTEQGVMRLQFDEVVVPGELVDLGRLDDGTTAGPEVFAVFEIGSTQDVTQLLERWRS